MKWRSSIPSALPVIANERLKKHGYHGLVMVWYEGICPDDMDDTPEKMTKAQIDTIKKLVEARLVSGASYE